MKWLKEAALDILVTLLIGAATLGKMGGLNIPLLIYTSLMLLLKAAVFFNPELLKWTRNHVTPAWLYHLLYAVNTAVLLIYARWIAASMWAGIWLISALSERKARALQARKRPPLSARERSKRGR